MTKERRYLSRKEFAERIGVKPDSLSNVDLPVPDALVGTVRGWLPGTVDRWQSKRKRARGSARRPENKALLTDVLPDEICRELACDLDALRTRWGHELRLPEIVEDLETAAAVVHQVDAWARQNDQRDFCTERWPVSQHILKRENTLAS